MRETILKFALAYASAGLPIFPLSGKQPATRHGFKDATTDRDQILEWFDNNQQHNIGLPLPKGTCALDVDPRSGGLHGLAELETNYAPLPETTVTISGRNDGGKHYYFKVPPGRLTDRNLPEGIDIRVGERHYLVAPPSVHPDTGGHYRFAEPEHPIADCPRWLLDLIRPTIKPVEAPVVRDGETGAGLIRFVAEAQEGQRNHILFWALCESLKDGIYPAIKQDLLNAALSVGLSEQEFHTTAASAERRMS